jgi:hypothetical protein
MKKPRHYYQGLRVTQSSDLTLALATPCTFFDVSSRPHDSHCCSLCYLESFLDLIGRGCKIPCLVKSLKLSHGVF